MCSRRQRAAVPSHLGAFVPSEDDLEPELRVRDLHLQKGEQDHTERSQRRKAVFLAAVEQPGSKRIGPHEEWGPQGKALLQT